MKKVGILTFHWADDYGAMLQAYGLKTFIGELGDSVSIIPYSNSNLAGRYWFLPKHVGYTYRKLFIGDYDVWEMLRNIKHFGSFRTKRHNMSKFRREYLTDKRGTANVIKLNTAEYDSVVIGSDQVWNPEITIGLDEMYTGHFPRKEDGRIIAYAASIGGDKPDEVDLINLGRSINDDFDAVSVREEIALDFLREYTDKEIECVPDPTFLPESDIWNELAAKGEYLSDKIDKPYVVFYRTEHNLKMYEYAHKLAEAKGLSVIDIRNMPNGPLEFLWLIKNAEYVVTNSFHGTVFSLLFERQFIVFAHSNKNARLVNLLEEVGLDSRLSDLHEISEIDNLIEWSSVRENVVRLRNEGREFIRNNI